MCGIGWRARARDQITSEETGTYLVLLVQLHRTLDHDAGAKDFFKHPKKRILIITVNDFHYSLLRFTICTPWHYPSPNARLHKHNTVG